MPPRRRPRPSRPLRRVCGSTRRRGRCRTRPVARDRRARTSAAHRAAARPSRRHLDIEIGLDEERRDRPAAGGAERSTTSRRPPPRRAFAGPGGAASSCANWRNTATSESSTTRPSVSSKRTPSRPVASTTNRARTGSCSAFAVAPSTLRQLRRGGSSTPRFRRRRARLRRGQLAQRRVERVAIDVPAVAMAIRDEIRLIGNRRAPRRDRPRRLERIAGEKRVPGAEPPQERVDLRRQRFAESRAVEPRALEQHDVAPAAREFQRRRRPGRSSAEHGHVVHASGRYGQGVDSTAVALAVIITESALPIAGARRTTARGCVWTFRRSPRYGSIPPSASRASGTASKSTSSARSCRIRRRRSSASTRTPTANSSAKPRCSGSTRTTRKGACWAR